MTNKVNSCVKTRRFAGLIVLALAGCVLLTLSGTTILGTSPQLKLGVFEGQTDVGITPRPGSALFEPARDAYTVTGGGANMWGTADAFHFIWRRWTGDVTLTAYVKILTSTGNPHRKAGLMIRQGLGPNDTFADALLHASGLTALQYRKTTGADTLEVESPISSPKALRLERRGNTFTLFVAGASGQFKQVGSTVVSLRDPVYVGLVVCSHDASALTTAQFTQVRVSRGGPSD